MLLQAGQASDLYDVGRRVYLHDSNTGDLKDKAQRSSAPSQ
jgi:hypothetical protein